MGIEPAIVSRHETLSVEGANTGLVSASAPVPRKLRRNIALVYLQRCGRAQQLLALSRVVGSF
jgi:hypothetical protein